MSGIGFSELIILALIGLIVLGPERLPRVANQIGGWLGQARRMTRVMKRQLEDELNFEKDLSMKPPPTSREPSKQPESTPPRDDDDFSPAHDVDDIGTGVGEDKDKDKDDSHTEESTDLTSDTEEKSKAKEKPAPVEKTEKTT